VIDSGYCGLGTPGAYRHDKGACMATQWTWAWPWWGTVVSFNVVQLALAAFLFASSSRETVSPQDARYLRWMRTMGLLFAGVAFYRSIFVSSYLRQLAWFDSPLNGSLLIRLMAFGAELSFAGLIAATLLRLPADYPQVLDHGRPWRTFVQTRT